VYIPGGVTYGEHELVFADKAGNAKPLTANKRPYEDLTISPDGKYIAATIEGPVTNTWVHDIARDTETRFNFGIENRDPAWSADGKHIAYSGYKEWADLVAARKVDCLRLDRIRETRGVHCALSGDGAAPENFDQWRTTSPLGAGRAGTLLPDRCKPGGVGAAGPGAGNPG
jgi:Tol biopolymer transport system component